jgi:hypothetical protein
MQVITHRLCLGHVRDDAVRNDEEDAVLGAVEKVPSNVGHVVDGGGKVGWAVQLDALDAGAVCVQDA